MINFQGIAADISGVSHKAEVAAPDGFQYPWIDTCSINKLSQQALEAVNSLYDRYAGVTGCYVHLADVSCTTLARLSLGCIKGFDEARDKALQIYRPLGGLPGIGPGDGLVRS